MIDRSSNASPTAEAAPPSAPAAGPAPVPPPTHPTPAGPVSARIGRWVVLVGLLALLLLVAALVWVLAARRGERAAEAPPAATLRAVGDEVAVVLDTAAQQRAGIQTAVLGVARDAGPATDGAATARDASAATRAATRAATSPATVALTGELVVDPGRLTTIRAAVPGRLTAPGGRWPALGEQVAAGRVVAQVSDARPLAAPRGGVVTAVRAQPGELVQAGQELLRLADLSVLLARIAWRADAPPPPTAVRIAPLTTGASRPAPGWTARLVGPAAEVDSLTRLPIYLYRLTGITAGARPGLPVMALVPERLLPERLGSAGAGGSPAGEATPSRAGEAPGGRSERAPGRVTVLVPTDAVVQWEGLAWVFVQRALGRFVRLHVDTGRPVRGGWLVAAPPAPAPGALSAGDAVVVRGAQQLLSAEFSSRLPTDEEGGT